MDLCLGINAKTITVPKNIKYIDIKAYTEVCYQKSPIDNLESLQFDFFDYKKIIREKGVIYIKFDVNHEKLTKKYYQNGKKLCSFYNQCKRRGIPYRHEPMESRSS